MEKLTKERRHEKVLPNPVRTFGPHRGTYGKRRRNLVIFDAIPLLSLGLVDLNLLSLRLLDELIIKHGHNS